MSTIKKHKDRWRAQASACGQRLTRTFDKKSAARAWVAAAEMHLRVLAQIRAAAPMVDQDLTVAVPRGYWEAQRANRDVDEQRQYKLYQNLVTAVKESGCPPIEVEIALLSTIITFVKSERMDKLAETLDYINWWVPDMASRKQVTISSGKHLETHDMAKEPIDGKAT